jgi:hypothetical protein
MSKQHETSWYIIKQAELKDSGSHVCNLSLDPREVTCPRITEWNWAPRGAHSLSISHEDGVVEILGLHWDESDKKQIYWDRFFQIKFICEQLEYLPWNTVSQNRNIRFWGGCSASCIHLADAGFPEAWSSGQSVPNYWAKLHHPGGQRWVWNLLRLPNGQSNQPDPRSWTSCICGSCHWQVHLFAAHAEETSLSICGSRRGESKTTGETEGPKSRSKKMMYRLFFENKCLDNTCPINAGVLVLSTWLIWNRTVLSIVTYTQLEPEMPCASLRNSDFPLWRLHGFCRLQPPPGFPNTTWSPTGLPKHHMKSILNGCSNHQMCLVGSFSIPIYLKINQPHDWKKHEQIAWWCSCNLHIRLQCLCTTAFAKVLCGNRIFQVVVDHSP